MVTLVLLVILIGAGRAFSQTESSMTMINGITVANMIEKSAAFSTGSSYDSDKSIIYQFFFDENNKTYFGYDLEIVQLEDQTKFRLLIKPVTGKLHSSWQSKKDYRKIDMPNLPREISVTDGDIISLDILENPKTKEKIKNYLMVTRKSYVGPRFADKYISRDFSLDDVNAKLSNCEIRINGQKAYKERGAISGNNIAVYLPGKGRFIFSPFQRDGYDFKKVGTITNNRLNFSAGEDEYEIISESAILGDGGKWNIWVRFEPDFIPSIETGGSEKSVLLQSGAIEGLIKDQN